ncbi:DPP IV N-terminal domain-containing protein, partial [Cylindrospermopsis raciborskii CS-506_B]|nr:DPP IV N-terminal domain-containing protein [Cylindrospermopsis raciborskii CS-506_B]
LKFIKDENSIQFEIRSTVDEVKKDTTKKAAGAPAAKPEKKVFYFEYNLISGVLTELKDFQKPKDRMSWASFSPDQRYIIFSKKHNLYWMDSANYRKAQIKEEDSTIVEHQLTTDGVENYSYGGGGNETNVEKERNKDKRKPAFILWSPDGKYFSIVRSDNRKVKDLWVINNIADPRPTLETYKYQMPGEKEAPVRELYVFNFEAKTNKKIRLSRFKDQEVGLWPAPPLQKN